MNNKELIEQLFADIAISTTYHLSRGDSPAIINPAPLKTNIIEVIIVNEGIGDVYILYGTDVSDTKYTCKIKKEETCIIDKYRGAISVITDDIDGAVIQVTVSRNNYRA